MGQGKAPITGRYVDNQMVIRKKDIKVPNWVSEYNLFRSKEGNTSPDDIRKEYRSKLDQWLGEQYAKGKDASVNDFRKEFGIVIDEQGRELLTTDYYKKRTRFQNEKQQKPTKLEGVQNVKRPFWNENKFVKLEGHHKKGLAELSPFFRGANQRQAFELRQRMLNEDFAGGTDKRNWAWLTEKQHDLTHKILGYVTDEELADPSNKGLRAYDINKPGLKGRPGFSNKFLKQLKETPFDRPDALGKKGLGAGKWTGPIDKDMVTRGDLLMDYLRTTEDAYDDSISQARQRAPMTIPTDAPGMQGLMETTGKKFGPTLRVGGKLRTADSVAQIASGNYVGGGLSLALQNQSVQKQIMKRLARFGGQQVAGMAPGAGAAMAALETKGYASQGRWTQAGISAFSGIVGEIPLVGDAISGAADLTNTVIDITTGNLGRPSLEDQHTDIDNQRTKMASDGFLENFTSKGFKKVRL
tara:strand:- start:48 stop:1454 length:1407 start_codon:yes stop_codon:yes gene_type:complete